MIDTALSETGTLGHVLLAHVRDAFVDQARIDAEWRALHFLGPPDMGRALAEYNAFARIVAASGARITWLPPAPDVTLDAIYVRDPSVLVPGGVVLASMGKRERWSEPAAQRAALEAAGCRVMGAIEAPGRLEGGDVVWLDGTTVAVGRGYRTNEAGIDQFERLVGPDVTCVRVPLVHARGEDDVFHLMSIVSPVDRDVVVVYSPLMPVFFREFLLERRCQLVEVPDQEFASLGANVLALGARRCLVVGGNPVTRGRLEAAGIDVVDYDGREISIKGGGGPTCLTRPLVRGAIGSSSVTRRRAARTTARTARPAGSTADSHR